MQPAEWTFRTLVEPPAGHLALPLDGRYLGLGSCFAENLGRRFQRYRLPWRLNPHGIVYHPAPLAELLARLLADEPPRAEELVAHGGQWHSLAHHGRFADTDRQTLLARLAQAFREARAWLEQLDVLLLTFGTGWGYRHRPTGAWVANCHRLPQQEFDRELWRADDLAAAWQPVLAELFARRPQLQVVLTVSPVRHRRNDPRENQLGKAALLTAAWLLEQAFPERLHYFPAYEILLDDLRDYRFYQADLVHPDEQAIDYIWHRFAHWAFAPEDHEYFAAVEELERRLAHRPRDPESAAHRAFLQDTLRHLSELKLRRPHADFGHHEEHLRAALAGHPWPPETNDMPPEEDHA